VERSLSLAPTVQRNHDLYLSLAAGGCTGDCRLLLDSVVTVHTHGGGVTNWTEGASRVRYFLHNAAHYAVQQAPTLCQLASRLVL